MLNVPSEEFNFLTEDDIKDLSRSYYDTYCKEANYTNWQGLQTPSWEALPARQKNSWGAVARKSVEILGLLKFSHE